MTGDPNRLIAGIVESAPVVPLDEYEFDDDGGEGGPPQAPECELGDEPSRKPVAPEVVSFCARLEQNDTDNGTRLIAHFGADLLHGCDVGWHAWIGTHFERNGGDEAVVRLAQRTAKRIHLKADRLTVTPHERRIIEGAKVAEAKPEADRSPDDLRLIRDADEAREALKKRQIGRRKFAISSGNASRITAMISQALPHKTVAPEDLDADPMLFTCSTARCASSACSTRSVQIQR